MNFENQLPQVLLDSAGRSSGLVLLSGNRFSKIPQTVEVLRKKMAAIRRDAEEVIFLGEDVALEGVLRRVEAGYLVYWHLHTPTILHALHRIFAHLEENNREHQAWRLSEALIFAVGQIEVNSIQPGELTLIHETMLATPWIRKVIEEVDLKSIEESMRLSSEDSGMLSVNHSLLQNLIRRNIDIRTAFEVTRDPVHLDQLLKKAGF